MGHLGEGTPITTVQDKEIVLTASNGQYFRMKVADLAEAVRQVMPVATSEKNGLMESNFLFNYPYNVGIYKCIIRKNISSKKSLRIKIKAQYLNLRITLNGFYTYGFAVGQIIKSFAYYYEKEGVSNIDNRSYVEFASKSTSNVYYIGNPHFDGTFIYIDVFNKSSGPNDPLLIIESFYPLNQSNIEYLENANDLTDNYLSNLNETLYQFK